MQSANVNYGERLKVRREDLGESRDIHTVHTLLMLILFRVNFCFVTFMFLRNNLPIHIQVLIWVRKSMRVFFMGTGNLPPHTKAGGK